MNAKDLYTWCQTGEGYPDQLLRELEVSESAIDFLHSVMACDPAARPTAQVACEHRWWAEPGIRPRRYQPASIIPQSGRISRRSALDMRFPVELPDARQRSRRPQSFIEHGTWNSAALQYPKGPSDSPFWVTSGPSNPQIYPFGMYQHPYTTNTTPLRSSYVLSNQRLSESDYLANADFTLDCKAHARGLSYDSSSSKAPYHWPDVLRHQENHCQRRAQIASGSFDGSHEPQRHDTNLPEQVRFEPGLRYVPQASPEQGDDREGRTYFIPAQMKASVPDTKGLRRLLTLGDLTIDTNSHQNVQILVNPVKKKSKKRPQTSQIFGETAPPGASFGESGRVNAHLENVSRTGQTVQFKSADAQLKNAIDQLSRKEEEILKLGGIVARTIGKEEHESYSKKFAKKLEKAGLLRAAVDRLRDGMNEVVQCGQAPVSAFTWQKAQAGKTDGEPRTRGEDLENRGDSSWPWLGGGG